MQIKYVVPQMVFQWPEDNISFSQKCEFVKSLGFGVELWANIRGQAVCRYAGRNWDELAAATENMPVLLHSRTDSPTIEQWKEQIECAKLLGADIVTDMKNFGIVDVSDFKCNDFSSQIVKLAEASQIKLCVEADDLSLAKAIKHKFESVWFSFNVCRAYTDAIFTFKEYVDDLAERVAHIQPWTCDEEMQTQKQKNVFYRAFNENRKYLLNCLEKYQNEVFVSLHLCPSILALSKAQVIGAVRYSHNLPNLPQEQPLWAAVVYNAV